MKYKSVKHDLIVFLLQNIVPFQFPSSIMIFAFLLSYSSLSFAKEPTEGSATETQNTIQETESQSTINVLDDLLPIMHEIQGEPSAVPIALENAASMILPEDYQLLWSFFQNPQKTLQPKEIPQGDVDQQDFDIPIVMNASVEKWISYFTGSGKKHFQKWIERGGRYTPMMRKKLKAAGLPQDLVYLSMIESGFSTYAHSSASAVGLWQFIKTTGSENGLRIDWWVDERRNPEKATDAAIRFLGYLHKKFGDWYLAWAAYNGGPGRVGRAITKYEDRNFWTLVEKNAFPAETDNYVPKIIAAAIVGKYATKYGFDTKNIMEPLQYDTVEIGPNYSISSLAKAAELTEESFLEYNPQYLRWALPATPETHVIYVPDGKTFLKNVKKIPETERTPHQKHQVKKGESLGSIAQKYGTTVQSIQTVNKIKNPNSIRVGTTLIIPTSQIPTSQSTKKTTNSSTKKPPAKSSRPSSYTVAKGDSLGKIAKKYGLSTEDLLAWNNLSNANKIYVGQSILLYPPKPVWITHVVVSGDNLGKIAQKYNCSVTDLQTWNNLSGTKIYVGQKLKIKNK